MKKLFGFLMIASFMALGFSACNKDDDGSDPIEVKASLLKTIGVVYTDGIELYEFFYNEVNDQITEIKNYWNDELDKTITYDYSVAGKLTITSGDSPTVYELNSDGLVTKEIWSDTEWAAYEYNTDGYLVKITEHWGNADHLKMEAVVTNGNIMKHTTYDDDGVTVKKIKEFTYTTGDNINDIHQANMIDNNTKPVGNLFGKPSKKLVDYLEYWDPRESTIQKKRTTITYEFDDENRPSQITRSGDGWSEVYTYSYYEE